MLNYVKISTTIYMYIFNYRQLRTRESFPILTIFCSMVFKKQLPNTKFKILVFEISTQSLFKSISVFFIFQVNFVKILQIFRGKNSLKYLIFKKT